VSANNDADKNDIHNGNNAEHNETTQQRNQSSRSALADNPLLRGKKTKRTGLGRGLDALLPKVDDREVQRVALEQLQVSPYQPRKTMDPEALAELTRSIANKGVLQPLLVRPLQEDVDGQMRYEIVAGERRFRAATQAGLSTVPVVSRQLDDQETLEIAIIENLQRENLNALEEAQAFKQLMDFGMNQEEVAASVGKSRSAIANSLRLLRLPTEAQRALAKGAISAGHARAILAKPEPWQQWALEQITMQGLSVRQAERLGLPAVEPVFANTENAITSKALATKSDVTESDDAADKSDNAAETQQTNVSPASHREIAEDLSRFFGAKVTIQGYDQGKIEVRFHSLEELQRLLEFFGYQA
jgi:ParB family chromosome partitioning protein